MFYNDGVEINVGDKIMFDGPRFHGPGVVYSLDATTRHCVYIELEDKGYRSSSSYHEDNKRAFEAYIPFLTLIEPVDNVSYDDVLDFGMLGF